MVKRSLSYTDALIDVSHYLYDVHIQSQRVGRKPQPVIVSGKAGSGKTHLLAELAVTGLMSHKTKPVIIVPNKKSLMYTDAMVARLLKDGEYSSIAALDHKLTLTPHGFAHALVEKAVALKLFTMPTILNAYQFDRILEEILAGQYKDGGKPWPLELRTAIQSPGFIPLLRDFLLRVGENFITPQQLRSLAHSCQVPLWNAIATTLEQYHAISALQATTVINSGSISGKKKENFYALAFINSSELIETAVHLLHSDDRMVAAIQQSFSDIFIDDLHSFTPDASYLFYELSQVIPHIVCSVDKNITPFSWRGANAQAVNAFTDDYEIVLANSIRLPENIVHLTNQFSLVSPIDSDKKDGEHRQGDVRVYECPNETSYTHAMITAILAAHEINQIPWEEMAIIVRNGSSFSAQLLAALEQEGIPYNNEISPPLLVDNTTVHAFCLVIDLYSGIVRSESLLAIFTSPLIGVPGVIAQELVDSVYGQIMHLKYQFQTQMSDQLRENETKLDDQRISELLTLSQYERLMLIIEGTQSAYQHPLKIVKMLYRLWESMCNHYNEFASFEESLTHPPDRLSQENTATDFLTDFTDDRSQCLNGQLDAHREREAYAVNTFLQYCHNFYAHYGSPLDTLEKIYPLWCEHYTTIIEKITLPPIQSAITLTSAHASAGREWKHVIIAGLQEGIWPNPQIRSDLVHTQKFLYNCHHNYQQPVPVLDMYMINWREERNLFMIALTRASESVDIMAINDPHSTQPTVPSEFFMHVHEYVNTHPEMFSHRAARSVQVKDISGYILHMRQELDSSSSTQVEYAIQLLSYLAAHQIVLAHPRNWYGFYTSTHEDILVIPDQLCLSPSSLDALALCPLGWFFAHLTQRTSSAMLNGMIVHKAAEFLANQFSVTEIIDKIEENILHYMAEPSYMHAMRMYKLTTTITRMAQAFTLREQTYRLVAVEKSLSCPVTIMVRGDQSSTVTLFGRVDRMEIHQINAMPTIIDIKNTSVPLTKQQAQSNLQLLAYRKMLDPLYRAAAHLYYPAVPSIKPTIRDQIPHEDADQDMIAHQADIYDSVFAALAQLQLGTEYMLNPEPHHMCRAPVLCSYIRNISEELVVER